MTKVRIDKWLWSVRIFKSRTLASDACKSGKVKVDDEPVKPSYMISEGEIVSVKKDGFSFQFRAIQLIEKRVGAPIAVTCYEDVTPEEEKNKYNAWFLNSTRARKNAKEAPAAPQKKSAAKSTSSKRVDNADTPRGCVKVKIFRFRPTPTFWHNPNMVSPALPVSITSAQISWRISAFRRGC